MHIAKNIRFLRKMQDLTQLDLAKKLGYKSSAVVNKWEVGENVPPADTISKLCKMFNVSMDDLYNQDLSIEREPKQASVAVKIYASVHAGIPDEAIDEVVDIEDIPARLATGGREYFGVKVRGDSMEPEYRDGDTVIVEVTPTCDSGAVCVVRVNGDEAVLRKVLINEDQTILQPLNPSYEPMFFQRDGVVPVSIAGVVREIRRRV